MPHPTSGSARELASLTEERQNSLYLRLWVPIFRELRPTIHNKRDKMLQSPGEERITCGLLCVVGCSFVDQPSYLL